MREKKGLEYICLFGGGAIRGAAHVGVLKALNELNVKPVIYGGSSVGSIVAALCSVGYTTEELAEIFLSVNFELFKDISFGFTGKFALSKGEVFLDWIRELIERKFYGDEYKKGENPPVKFKDIKKNLVIITTNLKKFESCEFSNFETPEFEIALAVRISCCMPGLMQAVGINEKLLVDGDLLKGKPMWSLSKNISRSKNRVLEVRLEGEFSGSDGRPVEYVNGMYSCMTYSETDFIKSIYNNYDRFDYPVINTGSVVVVDFNYPQEKRQEIIDRGYSQIIDYFNNFLPQKKHKLYETYTEILNYIRKIQEFMLRKKYNAVKNTTGELFILLSSENNYINADLDKSICTLQKLLFTNIKTGLLGTSKCENKESIDALILEIIKTLNTIIKEFETYFEEYSV